MISSGNSNNPLHLSPYEEAVGILKELVVKEGVLFAKISKVSLVLPFELEEKMHPHVGKRIAILPTDITDIPGKQYLFRVIVDQAENNVGGA